MALVDGGVLNNLPADVLVESGVDFVVGVDVSSHIRPEFAGNRPDMPTGKMKNASVLDTLFRIFESQAHDIGKLRDRAVDFWIGRTFRVSVWPSFTAQPRLRPSVRPQRTHNYGTQAAVGRVGKPIARTAPVARLIGSRSPR